MNCSHVFYLLVKEKQVLVSCPGDTGLEEFLSERNCLASLNTRETPPNKCMGKVRPAVQLSLEDLRFKIETSS